MQTSFAVKIKYIHLYLYERCYSRPVTTVYNFRPFYLPLKKCDYRNWFCVKICNMFFYLTVTNRFLPFISVEPFYCFISFFISLSCILYFVHSIAHDKMHHLCSRGKTVFHVNRNQITCLHFISENVILKMETVHN